MKSQPSFTRKGIVKMQKQATQLEERIQELESQLAHAAENGGDQWHDNFAYEQLTEQIRGLDYRLNEVHKVLNSAVIIDASSHDTVSIGTIVKINFDEDEETWTIRGYGESNPDKGIIAYDTPLAALMFGKSVGDNVSGEIAGRRVTIKILDISAE